MAHRRCALAALAISAVALVANLLPAAAHTASIKSSVTLQAGYGYFHGKVGSPKTACRANRKIKLFKVVDGSDPLLGSTTSNSRGQWAIFRNYEEATFYVKVPARTIQRSGHKHTCKATTSLPAPPPSGGPTIVDARVIADAGLQDRFDSGDVVRLTFDEDMADGLETSGVFVLTDADGDTFNLSCGGTASCVLSDDGANVDRVLTLTVNATIADTNGPGDGLLEMPATITTTNAAVADQSGTTLDLPASSDVIVDKEAA